MKATLQLLSRTGVFWLRIIQNHSREICLRHVSHIMGQRVIYCSLNTTSRFLFCFFWQKAEITFWQRVTFFGPTPEVCRGLETIWSASPRRVGQFSHYNILIMLCSENNDADKPCMELSCLLYQNINKSAVHSEQCASANRLLLVSIVRLFYT